MPSLDNVLARLDAAVGRLEALAESQTISPHSIGSGHSPENAQLLETGVALDGLGERLDRTIARLRAALGD